jgi:hypothetical protein
LSDAVAALTALLLGTFTNEEQVAFAREGGKPAPAWAAMAIAREGDGLINTPVDAGGSALGPARPIRLLPTAQGAAILSGQCRRLLAAVDGEFRATGSEGRCTGGATVDRVMPGGIEMTIGGQPVAFRRARLFRCWAAIPKAGIEPIQWWSRRAITLHDQGGTANLMTDEAVPQRFTLKMRNVVWPSGPNQPSLVLYVHTPEAGDRAVAYSWADPDAKRVGINIRSVQASCSLAEAGTTPASR